MKLNFFAIALFALASICAWGQATSQIQGVVQDETGSAVPGAEIKATQTDTGVARVVTSGPDGTYVLANLPIGPYRLDISKQGFSTYVQTGITLQVGSNPTINVPLKVGAVTEQVQVEANATLVETQATSVGNVVESKRILELPLNGRNAAELVALAGAAVPAGKAATAGMPGGLNISVAGGQLNGVTYFLDGTMYNNLFDAVNLPFPFPDALQEFKVETSTMTAQNGTHSAAAVSAVVRSGTNQYHGSLFEFLRNGEMNARNTFAARRDTLKRNQYGGTIGGPILKNKLFFFAGYQGTKTRSDPADRPGFVPSAQMLTGDFSGCNTFPATIRDPLSNAPFPNKRIPVTRFSAPSLEIVKLLPKTTAACGQTTFGPIEKINEYQVLGRVDYQISDKQTLFGRYMATTYLRPSSYALSGNILDTAGGGLDDAAQTGALGHTYLISPTTVNQFRASYNRVAVFRFSDDYFSPCDIGVKFTCYVPHQTVVTVSGGFTIGAGTNIFASFVPTTYTFSDDLSMVRGNHQFVFGASFFHYQHSQAANVFSAATFSFTGLPAATGLGMSDFMLGQIGSLTQGAPNTVFTTKLGWGLYGQDTWKLSRRLTVNLGLRWEPFLPQRLNNGAVYNFSWDKFNAGVRSTVFSKAPVGLSYAGDPGFQGYTGANNRYNQFAPRIGLAFDPHGDGKTSIRASAGISYDFPNIQIMSTPATAPPFGNSLSGLPGPFNFADPWATYPGGNPFPAPFGANAPFIQGGNFVAQQPDAKATTVYSWNFGVQRQIGNGGLVSATYMGTQTNHLWVSLQLNPAQIIPGTLGTCPAGVVTGCNSTSNTNQRRIASLAKPSEGQYLGFVDQFESGGNANYHGLLLSAQKRYRYITLNGNYTWSHCIGDVTIGSLVGGNGGTYMDNNNRRRDRGNCFTGTLDGNQAIDRRHIFNFTTVLESPRFNDRIVRAALTGWKLSSSYRYLSASYVTATTGIDFALTGQSGQRPNQVLSNPLCSSLSTGCWINPAAFQQPAQGTLGNLGRSNIPGPGYYGVDMALSRVFRIREGMSLEARGEAFNLTNSIRLNAPTLGRNSPQFGQILSAQDPRIMQVALKFGF
jgi:hypothetical protein